MPEKRCKTQGRVLKDNVAGIIGIFSILSLLPAITHALVVEKENNMRYLMHIAGLKTGTYWLVQFFFDYIVYLLVCSMYLNINSYIVLFLATMFILDVDYISKTFPVVYISFFLVWGFTQISMAYLLSTIFSKSKTSNVFTYFLIFLASVTCVLLNYNSILII